MEVTHGSTFIETIDILTSLAFQYGPFLFAILFMLFITRTARRWYGEVSTRLPPPEPEERRTFRRYFLATYCFSMFLVVLSICWWIYSQYGKHHVYEGTFVNLRENQYVDIDSQEFFTRQVTKQEPFPNGAHLRDYYFVIVSSRPLHRGDKIWVRYWELDTAGGVGAAPDPKIIPVELVEPNSFPERFLIRTENGKVIAQQVDHHE
jgi:hypothetical protein